MSGKNIVSSAVHPLVFLSILLSRFSILLLIHMKVSGKSVLYNNAESNIFEKSILLQYLGMKPFKFKMLVFFVSNLYFFISDMDNKQKLYNNSQVCLILMKYLSGYAVYLLFVIS